MADIVNLRLERKRKGRADRDAKAAENRIRHGKTKTETVMAKLTGELHERRLDAHRRVGPEASEPSD